MTNEVHSEDRKGAICSVCSEDMLAVADCRWNRLVEYRDGEALNAVPYGSEGRALFGRDDAGNPLADKRCHDCNVAIGGYHHPGCDVEECPRCHHQLISCDCEVKGDVVTEEKLVSKTVLADAKNKQQDALGQAMRQGDAELVTITRDDYNATKKRLAELETQVNTLRRHLHDLAMLEGTTDPGEHAERVTILREYE